MSLQLSSFRLCSIGERSARFNDLTLDLTAPQPPNELGRIVESPSDSVIWLRNGGGKSSLLSLFYALILPHAHDFMGRSVKRSLTDYIDNGDTSHTIAQWRSFDTGALDGVDERTLVTGAIYEWSDLRRPSQPERARDQLGTSYYCFYAIPGVIDANTLPLRDESGLPMRRTAVIAAIRERLIDYPAADLFIPRSQGEWLTGLHLRGLDPEMFRPQKQMNHVEGGVEDLFKFAAPKDFIDFLLDLTVAPERADEIADVLATISDVLAQKPIKIDERDFCHSVVIELDALARAHEQSIRAKAALDDAMSQAGTLGLELTETVASTQGELLDLAREARDLQDSENEVNASITEALARINYGQGLLAARGATEAEARSIESENAVNQLRDYAAAWALTRPLAEQRESLDRLEQLSELEEADEDAVAPVRLRRERAAAAYRQRLLSLSEQSAQQSEQSRATMARLIDEEEELRLAGERGDQERLDAEQSVAAARGELDRLDDEVARAVEIGDLPDPGADVRKLYEAAHQSALDHEENLAAARARRAQRPGLRRAIATRIGELQSEASRYESELVSVRRELATSETTRQTLVSNRRLLELAESTPGAPMDLEAEGSGVLARLREEISFADSALIRLEAARVDERRVLDAFSRSGFLPATTESEEVQAILQNAGLDADTGWEVLRSMVADDQHTAALRDHRLAAIGSGIVVSDIQVASACAALGELATVTISNIGLYSRTQVAEALAAWVSGLEPQEIVPSWVHPNEGLVSSVTARQVVAELESRSTRLDDEQSALLLRRSEDLDLVHRLSGFLDQYPALTIERLEQRHRELVDAGARLGEELVDNRNELEKLDLQDAFDAESEESHIVAGARVGAIATRLGRLVGLAERAKEWHALVADARERAEKSRDAGVRLRARISFTRAQAADARSTSESEERWSQELRREAESIRFLDTAIVIEEDLDATLDVLRERFNGAEQDFRQQSSRSVRAEREQGVRDQLARVGEELAGIAPQRLELARELLFSASGQHRASRVAETEKAQRVLEDAIATAAQDLVAWQNAQREASVFGNLEGFAGDDLPENPESSSAVSEWLSKQISQKVEAEAQVAQIVERVQGLELRHLQAKSRIRHFQLLAADLPLFTVDTTTRPENSTGSRIDSAESTPRFGAGFLGDDDEAVTARDEAVEAMRTGRAGVTESDSLIAKVVDRLRQCASRFAQLKTPARERIAHDRPEALAAAATTLAGQLKLRADIIDEELAGIAKDQQIVTDSLARLVAEAMTTLRSAERYSTLPDSVPAWAGKKMLTIRFEAPSDHLELRAIMDRVIDERVAAGVRVEGLPLLKEAVHAAAGPRGYVVKVLKPTADLVATHEDITRLGKWSGGEKLTVCVALYCTLAALRAANAGRLDHSGGVLLLDNPIGRASHGSLVSLQRDVAAAHGVQLVYTTGVKDPDAVSRFPNVVRLDNRAGRTRNRRYIVPEAPDVSDPMNAASAEQTASVDGQEPLEDQVVGARVARW